MEAPILTLSSVILNGVLPLLSVVIGGLITHSATFSIERQKIKKENENKRFETKMKMFQTLEFIEKTCEHYIMDYQDVEHLCVNDYLNLENFPTFHLIEIEKLSHVKFLIRCNSKIEYEEFLKIEKELKERREFIKTQLFGIKEGLIDDGEKIYSELSSETYKELKKIIKDIKNTKEKFLDN